MVHRNIHHGQHLNGFRNVRHVTASKDLFFATVTMVTVVKHTYHILLLMMEGIYCMHYFDIKVCCPIMFCHFVYQVLANFSTRILQTVNVCSLERVLWFTCNTVHYVGQVTVNREFELWIYFGAPTCFVTINMVAMTRG